MKAAVLTQYGVPKFGDFPDPDPDPGPDPGVEVIDVLAATLNSLDIATASGAHYLSPTTFPVVAGIEGVGRRRGAAGRVYFSFPVSPYGSMAEQTLINPNMTLPVPEDISSSVAATLGNAGLAALMPFTVTSRMQPGENVVILGGTGVVGRLAVQVARLLEAGSITVVGRDRDALESTRDLGATAIVETAGAADTEELSKAIRTASGGADVVADYTWGQPALAALMAGNRGVWLVQIGNRAGETLTVPAQLMRSLGVTVSGFMPIHHGVDAVAASYSQLCSWAESGELAVEYEDVPLSDVESAWERAPRTRHKLVLMPRSGV